MYILEIDYYVQAVYEFFTSAASSFIRLQRVVHSIRQSGKIPNAHVITPLEFTCIMLRT